MDKGDCVRLICYRKFDFRFLFNLSQISKQPPFVRHSDVFHWDCLSAREAALPANTALGGRVCPTCQKQIFPSENLISPVADVLRNRLGQVNWGRNELGLPLV